jgi:GT2 family glycosyltransferase
LTWRDVEQTERCVEALLHSDLIRKIIIVDNESGHALRPLARDNNRLILIESTRNLGFAAGVNTGLREALDSTDAPYILVINNDSVLDANSLAALVLALRTDHSLALVGPKGKTVDGQDLQSGGRLRWLTWSIRDDDLRPDFITWACVLLTRQTLETIGLLDERYFMYWEDVDFGLRLRKAGMAMRVIPDATLVHEVSSSHAKAGTLIMTYSTASLRHSLSKHALFMRLGGFARLGAKWARAKMRGDSIAASAILKGWRQGAHPSPHAYDDFFPMDLR